MEHRNTQFTGHMRNTETDQQGHIHLHPEPCIFYGSPPNFPHPSFNFHRHENALLRGMPQVNTLHPQHPSTNLELAVAPPSSTHNNRYLGPPSGIQDLPVQQANHAGAHDQYLSISSPLRVFGIPIDCYGRPISYMEGPFKRKNAEGHFSNYQYQSASAGPSSSVSALTEMPAEPNITCRGNDATSAVESGSSHRSLRTRGGLNLIRPESMLAHNGSHLIQGSYVAPPVQLHGNPWLDMHFGANNGEIGAFAWAHAPSPYVHALDMSANANGAHIEAGSMGMQGYRVPAGNGSSNIFMHPPHPQGHYPNFQHPPPHIRGYNANLPSELAATSSRQISTVGSSSTGVNPFLDGVDASGPTLLAPIPPMGFQLYHPQRRELVLESSARHHHHTLRHLRVLPEDEVAILEIPGYHDGGDSIDQHSDMRLDIDHMSYEELLALGEQIGSVGTGLSEEFIRNNLKIRIFASSATGLNLEEPTYLDPQVNFCVICQTEYEEDEVVGAVDCGHEYHRECIKKWLFMKNSCPVCKSTALNPKAKDL